MKKIVYVDMDGVLADLAGMLKKNELSSKEQIDEYVDNTEGVFLDLKPMPGAIEAFKFLTGHFETYILTTAPWKNISALSVKRRWVEKYLPETGKKRLIITHRKDLNKGDYLIDDRLEKGVDKFEGEHIHFGTVKFPDWEAVLSYLIEKEGIAL